MIAKENLIDPDLFNKLGCYEFLILIRIYNHIVYGNFHQS